MFQSIKYRSAERALLWECTIVDSEFTDVQVVASKDTGALKNVVDAYSKRKLNVAANLALAIKWIVSGSVLSVRRPYSISYSMAQVMSWLPEQIPEWWVEHREELMKYLTLV